MNTDNALQRRLVTIPAAVLGFVVVSLTMPALLVLALAVDAVRAIVADKPAVTTRLVVFLWLYLLGEVWALAAMAVVSLLPAGRSLDLTFRLQSAWVSWNFTWMSRVFGLSFSVEGLDQVAPPPILVLSRHASTVDTLLPARYVTRHHGIRLRYVLKKELLVDPALDLGGNRLPNHFVDRRSPDSGDEVAAIRELAVDLPDSQGVVIYPEGTRFDAAKRDRAVARLGRSGGPVAELAVGYRRVMPPRPAGTLALLDATAADVVVLAHRGLEGFARVKDMWSGGLIGSRVEVRLWRVPRTEIPEGRSQRIEWLYRLWADVDAWVCRRGIDG
ncbi:MAG: lysophospholipid acyltransferase family protein [Acidimicrobiia bacterium]|nr:lysophospholipid acyltransferase family protein [Acidimicrobiia bacterium]